ncbi:MAG TPA: antibiotic biosynthesis monooxygenase family protein [Chloroflexota bacterium]|nr:antibiotic biosynthesis monooxygenase family protein [Chloroflexota bacterium]
MTYIYTFSARAKSPDEAQRVCEIFGHLLSLIHEPGYRRGACTVSADDPRQIFIVEQWGSGAALRAWLDSEGHRKAIEQAAEYLEAGHFENQLYQIVTGGAS